MSGDAGVAAIAAAVGEPARARMLYALLDRRARTATELAALAGVAASTASAHLDRLLRAGLLRVEPQGRHRYFRLSGAAVARVLEGLSGLAGGRPAPFAPHTPAPLRLARTCYDHMAGAVAVQWCDALVTMTWLRPAGEGFELSGEGGAELAKLGMDAAGAGRERRKFATACLDWSERRPHLGGALGAGLLRLARERRWVEPQADGRGLEITRAGKRELRMRFGIAIEL